MEKLRVLDREQDWMKRKVKEAIHIKRRVPSMNKDQGYQLPHFLKMQWLPVDVRVEQLSLNIMHRIVHGGAPCYLAESFKMVSQVHDVETRQKTLSVSLPSTGINGWKALKLNGIKSWE